MAEVELRHVSKVYKDKKKKSLFKRGKDQKEDLAAVKDFNLKIKEKEFLVLIGPSGCGKSTLLRMIAGLEEISEGEIYIDGRLVNHVDSKDRDIAMVFQNYSLYPHMTVRENMNFPLELKNYDQDEIDKRVERSARILDIADLLDRKPGELSGGQKQRVAIGRAIVREPEVLLMDEPLSNLDAKLRNDMRMEIKKLREDIDTTFIYVTHDQTEAMTLGDRIVVIDHGRIQQIASPYELYNRPRNIFVANFIGTPAINIFQGQLVKEADHYYLDLAGLKLDLSHEKQERLRANKVEEGEVLAGIRPSKLRLADPGTSNTLKAKLVYKEMVGDTYNLSFDFHGQEVRLSLAVEGHDRKGLTLGSDFDLYFPKDALLVFDKDSGLNLEV